MLILVGASATGKTEIVKKLVSDYGIKKMVTYTTRSKRPNEVDGVDYNFITKEEFLKLKEENKFVETVCYNNNYYGTLKNDVSDDKVVILEPSGLESFYSVFPDELMCVYIHTDKSIREKRMRSRGDSDESIAQRLAKDDEIFDINKISHIDQIILNNDENNIDEVVSTIYKLYNTHCLLLNIVVCNE